MDGGDGIGTLRAENAGSGSCGTLLYTSVHQKLNFRSRKTRGEHGVGEMIGYQQTEKQFNRGILEIRGKGAMGK